MSADTQGRWSAARAILTGCLAVGTLDALDAIIFFGLRNGATPGGIFRSIAAGLIGRDAARAGGLQAAMLGALLHYFIAFGIVTVFYVASRRLTFLVRNPFVWGPIYGVLVYFFMNEVVIPLSALGPGRYVLAPFVNGILIHMFGVGLPSALVAARAASPPRS
jgi:hypothetical protein